MSTAPPVRWGRAGALHVLALGWHPARLRARRRRHSRRRHRRPDRARRRQRRPAAADERRAAVRPTATPSPGCASCSQRLRQARRERLERFDLGGVYDEISRELADIVDEERHGVDLAEIDERSEAERRGDRGARRGGGAPCRGAAPRPRPAARRPRRQGRPRCSSTTSCRRRRERRFEALVERLRSPSGDAGVRADERLDAVAEPAVAGAAQGDAHRPQRDARSSRVAARIRSSTSSWPATATSSRSSRGNLDELLEALARRAAAMQALLDSMTPEQRDELYRLSEALLDDAGLREQISQLGEQLRALAPGQRLERLLRLLRRRTPSASAAALDTMAELGDLDRLESLLRGVTSPAAPRRGRRRAGRRAARRRRHAVVAAAGRAHPPAGRRRPDRAHRGRAPADAAGHSPDRFERPAATCSSD